VKKKLLAGLALGFVTLAIFGALGDFRKLYAITSNFDPLLLIPVLALSLANYTLRYGKWQYYLHVLGHTPNAWTSLGVYYAGVGMAITPGKFGEVIKSSLIRSTDGIQEHETLPVVIMERLVDMLSILLLVGAGFGSVMRSPKLLIGGLILTVVMFAVFLTKPVGRLIYKILGKMLLNKLDADQLDRAMKNQRILLKPVPLLVSLFISVIAWACEAIGMYIIVLGLGGRISIPDAIFVYSTGTLAGAVSMLPGGLLATEASLAGLLGPKVMGVFSSASTAIAATLIVRLCTLWFAVLAGGLAFLAVRKHLRTNSEDDPKTGLFTTTNLLK